MGARVSLEGGTFSARGHVPLLVHCLPFGGLAHYTCKGHIPIQHQRMGIGHPHGENSQWKICMSLKYLTVPESSLAPANMYI